MKANWLSFNKRNEYNSNSASTSLPLPASREGKLCPLTSLASAFSVTRSASYIKNDNEQTFWLTESDCGEKTGKKKVRKWENIDFPIGTKKEISRKNSCLTLLKNCWRNKNSTTVESQIEWLSRIKHRECSAGLPTYKHNQLEMDKAKHARVGWVWKVLIKLWYFNQKLLFATILVWLKLKSLWSLNCIYFGIRLRSWCFMKVFLNSSFWFFQMLFHGLNLFSFWWKTLQLRDFFIFFLLTRAKAKLSFLFHKNPWETFSVVLYWTL